MDGQVCADGFMFFVLFRTDVYVHLLLRTSDLYLGFNNQLEMSLPDRIFSLFQVKESSSSSGWLVVGGWAAKSLQEHSWPIMIPLSLLRCSFSCNYKSAAVLIPLHALGYFQT